MPGKTQEHIDMYKNIGVNIHDARVARGWSGQYLAERIGITVQQLSKYEKGKNYIPLARLLDVAKEMGCHYTSFINITCEGEEELFSNAAFNILKAFNTMNEEGKKATAKAIHSFAKIYPKEEESDG